MHVELVLLSTGQAVPLTDVPLQLGRGPTNQVVMSDDTVSWNHAQLWVEGDRAWLRDLGSRNGTFCNDKRVQGAQPLAAGDVVRFGLHQQGRIQVPFQTKTETLGILQLEEVSTGLLFMLASNRFHIGSGPDAHLRIEGVAARAATLSVHEDEIWVGTDSEEFLVQVGQAFQVAGRSMRIVEARLDHVPTVGQVSVDYPYRLRLKANGPRGPEAFLTDEQGHQHSTTGNRAILLLLLGRAALRDRENGLAEDEVGWLSDEDVRTGIWGRGKGTKSGLNVLVHRTRKQLEADGFDPWFIEKKRRGVRARLSTVELES